MPMRSPYLISSLALRYKSETPPPLPRAVGSALVARASQGKYPEFGLLLPFLHPDLGVTNP